MTLRWLPLDALDSHPENANRMPEALLEKLRSHIERTGRYEPLIVRPMQNAERRTQNKRQKGVNGAGRAREGIRVERRRGLPPAAHDGARCVSPARKRWATSAPTDNGSARYQILNGHHRARVLRELGHRRARCDVWEVDDEEARLLLATLNRLEGRDDPKARARLVAALSTGRSAEELARLLPEPPDAVERLLRLAKPPPEPAPPDSLEPLPEALIFFLNAEQHALVSEALKEVQNAECRMQKAKQKANSGDASRLGRAERLERLALWYLESVGRR